MFKKKSMFGESESITITRKIEVKPFISVKSKNPTDSEINAEKKRVWDEIRTVDKWSFIIANRVVTECWAAWGKYRNVKKSNLPKIEPYKIYSDVLCIEFPELKDLKISKIASKICNEVYNDFRTYYYDYVNGKKSISNYKSGYPTYAPRGKVAREEKNKYIYLGHLLNNLNENYYFSTPMGKFTLFFGRDKSNNKIIIDKCRNGEYELCDSKIQYDKKKNKIFLLLSVTIPKSKVLLDNNKYLGVDLGIKNPIVASVYGEDNFIDFKNMIRIKESIFIGSIDQFLKEKQKYHIQRKKLQGSLKYTKGGHGRKRKTITLKRLTKKERNWTKNMNHKYSRELIDYALKYNCGNIVMENLSGFNDEVKNQKFIGRYWSYFELQTMIINKANKYNINVFKIDSRNTSKTCSFCDTISNDNRKSQSEFECVNCGRNTHADLNATRNIVKKHFKNLELIEIPV